MLRASGPLLDKIKDAPLKLCCGGCPLSQEVDVRFGELAVEERQDMDVPVRSVVVVDDCRKEDLGFEANFKLGDGLGGQVRGG